MITNRTKLRRSKTGQTVRLPKALELPSSVTQVHIVALGNTRVIAPVGELWDSWFDGPRVSDDFMVEREQPPEQQRPKI